MNMKLDKKENDEARMATSPAGIKLMIAGLAVLISGYILLCGGGSDNPDVFNTAMFDFRRLVAAPVVIVCGVIIEVVAIMKKS